MSTPKEAPALARRHCPRALKSRSRPTPPAGASSQRSLACRRIRSADAAARPHAHWLAAVFACTSKTIGLRHDPGSRRDNGGEWIDRTRWNEVTVFGEATRGYVKRNIVKGDLIFTSGSLSQTKWEKDGETFYGVTLACEQIERLSKGPNRADAQDHCQEAQDSRRAALDNSDIPF